MSSMRTGEGREKPICVALILCNDIIEDARSGKKTLVGLFNSITAPQLPATHPQLYLMTTLTSGSGEWQFAFRITTPTRRDLFYMEDIVRFEDPLSYQDLVVELRNLPLEEAGGHFVDLLIGGVPIATRRFTVTVNPDVR